MTVKKEIFTPKYNFKDLSCNQGVRADNEMFSSAQKKRAIKP